MMTEPQIIDLLLLLMMTEPQQPSKNRSEKWGTATQNVAELVQYSTVGVNFLLDTL